MRILNGLVITGKLILPGGFLIFSFVYFLVGFRNVFNWIKGNMIFQQFWIIRFKISNEKGYFFLQIKLFWLEFWKLDNKASIITSSFCFLSQMIYSIKNRYSNVVFMHGTPCFIFGIFKKHI